MNSTALPRGINHAMELTAVGWLWNTQDIVNYTLNMVGGTHGGPLSGPNDWNTSFHGSQGERDPHCRFDRGWCPPKTMV